MKSKDKKDEFIIKLEEDVKDKNIIDEKNIDDNDISIKNDNMDKII